ncbi:MAG: hypothetical protein E7324_03015 [Clostridiales bacterium]|nr:hypothetical protein [Clostridiales bacterium]
MKKLDIIAKAGNGQVRLYIPSQADEFVILRERLAEEKFTACDSGRQPDHAEILYRGSLDKVSSSQRLYTDTSAETNGLYYYWVKEIGPEGESLCHPILIRVRDTGIWWPRKKYTGFMEQIAKDFPDMAEVCCCGHTTRNYPMNYLRVGNRENSIVYIGAVHPGESGPELALTCVRRILETTPDLLQKTGIAILPAVSADCREDEIDGCPHYLRTNPNGVDLNRNFPSDWDQVSHMYGLSTDFFLDSVYRGHAPASEAETQAVIRMMECVNPRIAVSCHWLASVCEDVLLTSSMAADDAEYMKKATEVNNIFCEAFERPLEEKKSPEDWKLGAVCTGGSFPTWCYRRGIIAFDAEGGRHKALAPAKTDQTTPEILALAIRCHESAMRALLEYAALLS